MNSEAKQSSSDIQQRYEVSRKELPVHCPIEGVSLWNQHPRVYLPLEESGHAKCPYCGAEFILKD